MLQMCLVFQDSVFAIVAMVISIHQLLFFTYLHVLSNQCSFLEEVAAGSLLDLSFLSLGNAYFSTNF